MTATWGHWPGDGHRHVIQTSRDDSLRSRRLCRPSKIEDTNRVPLGSGESDLPACGLCNKRTGRRIAGLPPLSRLGWVAGTYGGNQTTLESK